MDEISFLFALFHFLYFIMIMFSIYVFQSEMRAYLSSTRYENNFYLENTQQLHHRKSAVQEYVVGNAYCQYSYTLLLTEHAHGG